MEDDVVSLAQILRDYHHVHHDIIESDCIIVLGSHDVRVADRGIDLFQQGYADRILFSGGVGRLTEHDEAFAQTTEAEVFAMRARERGVPLEKIMIEHQSTNTGENIQYSYTMLREMGVERLILVQKPYMERRTLATFLQQWPGDDIVFCVTSPQISFQDYPNQRITLEQVVHIMVGDLQRVIEYPRKGFQVVQDVPDDVMDAYHELIRLGFTQSMIVS